MKTSPWMRMSRSEFFDWRTRLVADSLETEAGGLARELIVVVDLDYDIVCDVCNTTLLGDVLYMTSWGLYCPACRARCD